MNLHPFWGAHCAPGVLERIQEAPPTSVPGCLQTSEEWMPAVWALCADPSQGLEETNAMCTGDLVGVCKKLLPAV